MAIIDKQRIAAVATLQGLGYALGEIPPPAAATFICATESDALHAALVRRRDALPGFMEGAPQENELRSIADAIEAYEAKRWPTADEPRTGG